MALTKVSRGLLSTGIVDNSNATAITIDSDERVGIGTASPQTSTKGLHVAHDATEGTPSFSLGEVIIAQRNFNSSQGCHIGIIGGSAGDSGIAFGDKDDSDIGKLNYNHGDNSMRFIVNTSEAFRIDSSLNLLVGNTVANPASGFSNQLGFGFTKSTGKVEIATTANDAALELGKNEGTDGNLLVLRKQGTAVGTIGTVSGSLALGSGDCYLEMSGTGDVIQPMGSVTGAASNGAIDLGASGRRFKDLYLSGGAYLGGTTSANYLTDYEEGTFTPDLSFGGVASGISWNTQAGRYTKIGRLVLVGVYLYTTGGRGSQTGNATVNMPFLSEAGHPDLWVPISNRSGISAGSNKTLTVYFPQPNFGSVRFYAGDNSGGANSILDHSSFSASSTLEVSFTISYMTSQ